MISNMIERKMRQTIVHASPTNHTQTLAPDDVGRIFDQLQLLWWERIFD